MAQSCASRKDGCPSGKRRPREHGHAADHTLPVLRCCRQIAPCSRPQAPSSLPRTALCPGPRTSTEGLATHRALPQTGWPLGHAVGFTQSTSGPPTGRSGDQAGSGPGGVWIGADWCLLLPVRRKAASQTDKPADKKEDESQMVSKPPAHPTSVSRPGRLSGPEPHLWDTEMHLVWTCLW